MAEQTKAQKKRAEARGRRRDQASEGQSRENQDDGALEGNEEQPLDAVKQAAKVAVAGAAVGAAAAAARALTRDHDESEPEPTPEPRAEEDQEPEPEEKPKPDEQEPQDSTQQDSTQEPQDSTQEPEAQAAPPREQPRDEERHGAAPDDAKATVKQAREQLEALLEVPVESVSGFERTRKGWLVTLEVLELSRIPESTDILASYEMELDDDRNLVRYTRGRRYHRSQADRGDQA
jgi:hypothetical protein